MTKAELEIFVAEMRDELKELKEIINDIHLRGHIMNGHLLEHVDNLVNDLYEDLGVKRLAKKTYAIAKAGEQASNEKKGEWRKGKMWVPDEIAKATEMYEMGQPCDDIGPQIGRSPLSVMGKLYAKGILNKDDTEKWDMIKKSFDK